MADSELLRTHPATVAVRSLKALWQMLAAFIALVVFGSVGRDALPVLGFAALIGLSALIGVGFSWLAWWRFRYGIVGADLIVVEGLLVRKRRTIPLARVHGVNLTADVFMRIMGLVEVVVQTAGGGANEPEAKIGAITLRQAEELRSALLFDTRTQAPAAAPGVAPAESAPLPLGATPPEQVFGDDPLGRVADFRGAFGGSEYRGREVLFEHKVPLGRLIIGEITSNRVPITLLVFVAIASQLVEVVGIDAVGETASAAARLAGPFLVAVLLLATLFALAVATAIAVARDFGFTARRYETRIETEAGLLERRQISLPVTRIQAVRIEESWLRKLMGLVTIHVDTAGLERGAQQGQQLSGSKAMVPIARAEEVPALMHALLPEAEDFPKTHPLPPSALRFYVLVPTLLALAITGLATMPAAWFIYRPAYPWMFFVTLAVGAATAFVRSRQWRAAGVGTDRVALTLQTGIFGVKRVRITRTRIQSLTVRQNPFQRRARLATLRTVSVSGSSPARYGVSHLDEATALRIMAWYEKAPTAS